MTSKDKFGLDKVLNRFNKEFEKTSSHFNKLINDTFKQLDSLQSQIQEPIKKAVEDLDKLRDKEMDRFQRELDKRLDEFHALQSQLLERLGVDSGGKAPSKPAAKKSTPVKKTQSTKKSVTSKKASPAKKAVPAKKKAVSVAKASTAKASDKLSALKGVGPALEKKLNDAGINSLKQIAKPSAKDKKILEAFATQRGADTWQKQAQDLSA